MSEVDETKKMPKHLILKWKTQATTCGFKRWISLSFASSSFLSICQPRWIKESQLSCSETLKASWLVDFFVVISLKIPELTQPVRGWNALHRTLSYSATFRSSSRITILWFQPSQCWAVWSAAAVSGLNRWWVASVTRKLNKCVFTVNMLMKQQTFSTFLMWRSGFPLTGDVLPSSGQLLELHGPQNGHLWLQLLNGAWLFMIHL